MHGDRVKVRIRHQKEKLLLTANIDPVSIFLTGTGINSTIMHTGTNYSLMEVIFWTRRDIYTHLAIAILPTIAYYFLGWHWLALPWLPIALLGTAVAFVVGFKNNASYDRTWEARRIWGTIINNSRVWGVSARDFVTNKFAAAPLPENELHQIRKTLIYRHLAWVTALRYQLREGRSWEGMSRAHNAEYRNKWFRIDEHDNKLEDAIKPFLSDADYREIFRHGNKATHILSLQSTHLKALAEQGYIDDFRHMELQNIIGELYQQQGASERIKNFPYPRQYATVNLYFIRIFALLLPLGMMQEFSKMGEVYVWLAIPFSVLAGWVFTTMEKIGEASENPFEGNANDVPITALSRTIEIDLRGLLREDELPKPLTPTNNILS